jgi:hypothetical protein
LCEGIDAAIMHPVLQTASGSSGAKVSVVKMVDTAPLFTIDVDVGPALDIGKVDGTGRRCVPITGGRVTGTYNGIVLPGADWQSIGTSGALEISAHYAFESDGDLVEVESNGLRHAAPEVLARLARGDVVNPDEYYFRTAMRFRTASVRLAPLNALLAVAHGERLPQAVRLTVFRVL